MCYVTDGAHSKVERQNEGVLYLTSKNIGVGSLILDKVDYISRVDYERLFSNTAKAQRRPQEGDIITGIIGTFGNAYRYKSTDGFGVSSAVALIRPDQNVLDSGFLYYVLTSPRFKAVHASYKSGSVQGYTNIPTIKQLPFTLPPLVDQKAIAHILGTLDDKIELNRQMNATLEAMAQALFKSWFVDFDPVIDNALAAGHPIPEPLHARAEVRKALGDKRKPLPEAIQKQFPSRFVFNEEMGWVPEGWGTSVIGDEVETTGGGTPSTKEESFWVGGVHSFCTPKDMSKLDSIILMDTDRHLTEAGVNKISSGQLPAGAVLMSSRAPIGYLAISDVPVSVNQGIIAMLPSDKYGAFYLLCWAHFNMEKITDRANGSTFLEISKKNFRPIPFLIPSNEVIQFFNEQAEVIYEKALLVSEGINGLSKLRDTLLPKLLSGQLRIPDADRLAASSGVGVGSADSDPRHAS